MLLFHRNIHMSGVQHFVDLIIEEEPSLKIDPLKFEEQNLTHHSKMDMTSKPLESQKESFIDLNWKVVVKTLVKWIVVNRMDIRKYTPHSTKMLGSKREGDTENEDTCKTKNEFQVQNWW